MNAAIRDALAAWRAAEARSMTTGLDGRARVAIDADIERHRQAFMIACGQATEHDILGLIAELRDAEVARGSAQPCTPAYRSAASREEALARTISLSVSAEEVEADRTAAAEHENASSRSRKAEERPIASVRKPETAQSH
jgi:hypothetical protein